MPGIPGKPVLLTGAAGALGRVLARNLGAAGFSLRLTDIAPFPDPLPTGASFTRADLNDGVAILRLAEGCGFHLVHLDCRQESTRHTQAVTELFARQPGAPYYQAFDEDQRLMALAEVIAHPHPFIVDKATLTPETRETLEVFEVMARLRAEIGPGCFGQYVISMTHAASHVMEVLLLARLAGLAGRDRDGWFCQIEVSPLFETIEDLGHIDRVMSTLFDNPTYSALLKASGNRLPMQVLAW